MTFFNKKKTKWEKPFSEKVANRVSKISTNDLEMWTEQSIYELGRCLSGFQKTRDMFYLNEAVSGAEALHAVVEELHKRHS